MPVKTVFMGLNGDQILEIIDSHSINWTTIYTCEFKYENGFQHGADTRRGAAFVARVQITYPDNAVEERRPTPGVPDTFIIKLPVGPNDSVVAAASATIEMIYARILEDGVATVETVHGEQKIREFLQRLLEEREGGGD